MIVRVALCLVLALAVGLRADEAPEVRILSYNVQFLPGIAQLFNARGNDDYRPRELAKVLADYDAIGLNEVFELGPRKIILDALRSAWGERFHVYECPEPGPKVGKFNAGLAIVSKYPIVATGHIAYSAWSTKKEFGVFADEFAAKGALFARVRLEQFQPPIELDVFTTHLDSKLASARAVQVKELAAFAKENTSPERPAILMGDFNTRGNPEYQKKEDSEYRRLIGRLGEAVPGLVDSWLAVGTGDGGTSEPTDLVTSSRIDYVFFAPGSGPPPRLKLKSSVVRPFLDSKVTSLSDHSAVEAILVPVSP